MADWSTIASTSTALALATFSSVRSSQRSARVAEQALRLNLRPVLHPSRLTDPAEKVRFGEGRYVKVDGGQAAFERDGDTLYLVIPLRNIGAGLGVLHGWRAEHYAQVFDAVHPSRPESPDAESFREQARDLYVPPGDVGFWQGAIRVPDDPFRADAEAAFEQRDTLFVDLLYGDEIGGQRTITRFVLSPREQGDRWIPGVVRHWHLDGDGPRR